MTPNAELEASAQVPVNASYGRGSALRTIAALILREMATTFGRSPGGYVWALLEPIAAIVLLSFAFSLAFRAPPLGADFTLFYATGYLPFILFHDLAQKIAVATRFSRPLLSFSAVGWVETISARFLLNTLTHLAVFTIVISALLILTPPSSLPDWPKVLSALVLAALLALGTGTVNCFLFLSFPAWERIWVILVRPLFLVSGVLFLLEDVPAKLQPYLAANPLYHVTGMMREAVYPAYSPAYVSASFGFGTSLALLFLGTLLLRHHHDDLIAK